MTRDLIHRWFAPAAIGILLLVPLATNSYIQFIINQVIVYVIIAIGLNLLLGYAGQFAFAHAALMGIGAYTAALLMHRLGVTFWIAVPAGGFAAAAIGSLGALPAMRMKRVYLALMTLAIAELIQWVLVHWKVVTLGTDGVKIPHETFLFRFTLASDYHKFYLILAAMVALYVVARRLMESKFGRSLVAIRENEIVAQCNGISIAHTKAAVFAVSAFYAGIGGALFALVLGHIVPDGFGLFQLVVHFSIVVIGGLISMFGSVIGALLLTTLPELLRGVRALQELIYGVLLMVFIIFMPGGIAGFAKQQGWLPDEILVRGWRELRARLKREGES